jgi:anti-anti-sigma factor
MSCQQFATAPELRRLAHFDAYRLSCAALNSAPSKTVILDLSGVEEMTTSAFARLILLRRQLRRQGRDVVIKGLRGRAARLYEINRLDRILPRS